MKTLRNLLDLPLPQLANLLKEFLDSADQALTDKKCCGKCNGKSKSEEVLDEDEDTGPKVASDLAIVLEFHKAIAEKYQASESEGLLDHIAAQLAQERNLNMEDVAKDDDSITIGELLKNEIKAALAIDPEKRKLLKLDKIDRVELVVSDAIRYNVELVDSALAGDKDDLVLLESAAVSLSFDTIDTNDLKFALRSALRSEYKKRQD